LLCSSCASSREVISDWPIPTPASSLPVDFKLVNGGYFITAEHATNIATNVEEQKAYTEKLRVLIDHILKHYEK